MKAAAQRRIPLLIAPLQKGVGARQGDALAGGVWREGCSTARQPHLKVKIDR